MPNRWFLVGGGGHGRVLLDALLASGIAVEGVVDPALTLGDQLFGVPVVGGDEFLDASDGTNVLLVNGLGASPSVRARRAVFERLKARQFCFGAVRHPSAVIGRECELGEGSQVMAGAILQNRVRLGDNAVINTGASIDHDCRIGPHAFVAPGAALSGGVLAADGAFIGAGATIVPGVEVGAHAIVGAGAVVLKTVPAGWIVAGNPAVKTGTNT